MVAKYAIEHWTRIPCEVELAHEFRYRDPVVDEHTLVVSVSQSGETMDTLMAVKHAHELGALTVSICNTHGSTIPRESDAVLYTHAGPEIAVASTKAFLAQITACYLLGLYLAQVRGGTTATRPAVMRELRHPRQGPDRPRPDGPGPRDRAVHGRLSFGALPRAARGLPRRVGRCAQAQGDRLHPRRGFRGRRAQARADRAHRARPAGIRRRARPRHPHDLHSKVVSNIQEIRARGARTLVIAEDGDEAVVPVRRRGDPGAGRAAAPATAASPIVPLQVFACELATAKGLDVDQPRNLAKSVTVE
jgi:glucosamine--fructose-6-phosphate aminotransferase (isomerizing)